MNSVQTRIIIYLFYQVFITVTARPKDLEPLILTPLIEKGHIKEALRLSKVQIANYSVPISYSGYFTVQQDFKSNLFFWFFPSNQNFTNDPVILWLQGGPGWSSLTGLFTENGPFLINNGGILTRRDMSWTKNHSVLYIDQPVGTGYSFTQNGYAENQTIISEHLYSALNQFYTLFPEIHKNEFFIAGESYAGKYIPALGWTIKQKNSIQSNSKLRINLQGLIIGNGLVDPENQMVYSDYLYQLGLIDISEKEELKQYENRIIKFIQEGEFLLASNTLDKFVIGYTQQPLILTITGLPSLYNYLLLNETNQAWAKFIQRTDIRRSIHVGNVTFNKMKKTVEKKLWLDIPRSQASVLSELLSHYRILLYSGQTDIIVAYPTTVNFLSKLIFSGADEYKRAYRKIWNVDGNIAGYIKSGGNLTEALVRNAGHMVPTDQAKWCYSLIFNFVRKTL